jgi:hypothetical protein
MWNTEPLPFHLELCLELEEFQVAREQACMQGSSEKCLNDSVTPACQQEVVASVL